MLERAFARWHDSENATLILLALFVVAWTAFHTIVFAPIGLHSDMTEVFSWSRHPLAGYYKHPPLSALICTAWFAIFPAADWAFYLLAMLTAALGLFFTDLIAKRFVADAKRPMVLLLLLMTPFYQFIGQKFNANAVLLATWPLAVYCFLRAFESRTILWSIAAGLAVAVAMLGKYYSIYLIAGIVIGALTHPQAGRYLKSPSPWISAAVGLLAMAPHVEWLWRTGFQTFDYAYTVHGQPSVVAVLMGITGYLAGSVGYLLFPLAIYGIVVSPSRRQFLDALWPRDGDRRMLTIMLAVFLLLPPLTAPLLRIELTSLWTMQSWFLLPIILLAAPSAKFPRRSALRCAAGLLIFTTIAVVVAAPVLAWLNFS
ncbi:MAG: glycosyltransferase family 39 protein, partial [Bradyrhizobium sp.]|uniref:glycosyltransferase family 39 protein n=1 Tax=Bradyrhizobium sp. TaxID=376 RepID=UPI001DBF0DD5